MPTTKHILVYSDSLTWGIIPTTRQRLPFEERWPGVLHAALNARMGGCVRLTEDCLNGRRTAFDDPYKPGRNALSGIQQVIEAQSPLDLVILLLGTNDFQSVHQHKPWHSAMGISALVHAIRTAPIEPGMPTPPILVIAPPAAGQPSRTDRPEVRGRGYSRSGSRAGDSTGQRRRRLPLLRLEHDHHQQQA